MRLNTTNVRPRLEYGFSPKLLALTTTHGLHMIKMTQFDPDEPPVWVTACSNAFSIDEDDILWWLYADTAKELIEQAAGAEG